MCLHTDFWDHHRANTSTHLKEMNGERLVALLSEMGLGDANIGEAQVFVSKTMKYVVKSID